jgi:uncharacterized protein (TIGR03083 family)
MADVRTAFAEAAAYLVAVAEKIPEAAWDKPGLGEWNVRELVGHASRALITVPAYLAEPAERVDLPTAVDYFRRFASSGGAGGVDAAIAERGRQAAAALGDDPASSLRTLMASAIVAVGEAPGGALVGTPFGGMRLSDYLQTRIFELTVHGLDVVEATGVEADPPRSAVAVTLHLAAELAAGSPQAGPLLLAMTGRGPLPPGFTILRTGGDHRA